MMLIRKGIFNLLITCTCMIQACKQLEEAPREEAQTLSENMVKSKANSEANSFSLICAATQDPTLSKMEGRVSCKMLVKGLKQELDDVLDSWHWRPINDNLQITTSVETSSAAPNWHATITLTSHDASLTDLITAMGQLKVEFIYIPKGNVNERTVLGSI